MAKKAKILIYGYGNPGRQDDGLGPGFVDLVEEWILENGIEHINTDTNYQLNIEDASTIRDYDIVIFVDATVEPLNDFMLTRVKPSEKVSFTMHAMEPSFILDLCLKLYEKAPDVFLLKIKGYEYQLQEGMTKNAEENLMKAFMHLKQVLMCPEKIPVLNGSPVI